jgi:tetratricopeptide (TPR) repeat protein
VPDTLRFKKNQAQTLLQQQRLNEARDLYYQICQTDCGDAEAWFNLGLLNGMLGDMEAAVACNQTAIALRPDYAEAHFNHAKALQALGRLHDAKDSYRGALRLRPSWPEACNNLGNVLQELGRPREAEALYRQALAQRDDYVEARVNLGNALRQRGEPAEATEHYRRVLAARSDYAPAYKFLGSAHLALGELGEALGCYRQAARLDPADTGMIAAQAAVLERQGHIDAAYALIKPLVDGGAATLEVANVLATLCDKVGRCNEAVALLERGLSDSNAPISRERRSVAHFSLGLLYDRAGDYDRAFTHYRAGNDLKPGDFDRGEFTRFIDELIDTFDADFMTKAPRARHGSRRPLFIVGMPRSGTSLVEQILASHPQVCGGGELEDIRHIAFGVGAWLGSARTYPRVARELTAADCDAMALSYLNKLAALSSGARYVTDKMPQNFLALGLIALLFPEARVIHCLRDPLDTCLSCYFHDFTGYHPYAYRLESLGFYYRQYQRLMHHWRTVLSLPMLDVVYEDLVAGPKAATRQLLAFCGLDWDERCLRFYESERIVHTSSYQQVRRPIYKRSLGRWRQYVEHLEPLRRALEE